MCVDADERCNLDSNSHTQLPGELYFSWVTIQQLSESMKVMLAAMDGFGDGRGVMWSLYGRTYDINKYLRRIPMALEKPHLPQRWLLHRKAGSDGAPRRPTTYIAWRRSLLNQSRHTPST